MDIKIIGIAAVAGLCDAVTEIMTGQPTEDEKMALLAQVENDRDAINRFYEGVKAAFRKDPGNAISLFLMVTLDDIRTMTAEKRSEPLWELLFLLEAAHERGHVTEEEAVEVVDQIEELLAAVGD